MEHTQAFLEFQDIRKSFSGREVLKGISFSLQKGQILFILGTSGTGKSVLLKNLVGLLRPDSGKILFHGENLCGLDENGFTQIRKKIGMVFQQPALFDALTVFENVAFGLRRLAQFSETEIREKVQKALHDVHLQNIEDKFPSEISYGMQKRVSIARTVVLKPEILLFDEPTTGLDPITTNAINRLILELSKNLKLSSLVVSHDMGCALEIADQIVVLDQGHVIESGTVAKVKQSQVPLVRDFLLEVVGN